MPTTFISGHVYDLDGEPWLCSDCPLGGHCFRYIGDGQMLSGDGVKRSQTEARPWEDWLCTAEVDGSTGVPVHSPTDVRSPMVVHATEPGPCLSWMEYKAEGWPSHHRVEDARHVTGIAPFQWDITETEAGE